METNVLVAVERLAGRLQRMDLIFRSQQLVPALQGPAQRTDSVQFADEYNAAHADLSILRATLAKARPEPAPIRPGGVMTRIDDVKEAIAISREATRLERERCAKVCRKMGMDALDAGRQVEADFAFEIAEAIDTGDSQ